MGNAFGNLAQNGWNRYRNPEIYPAPYEPPTFDANLGFENGRKERVMIATEEEMKSAKIPLKNRDYCAHKLLEFRSCRKDVWPFVVRCGHEKHAYLTCQYDDFVLRLKEYEREKRLRLREQKVRLMEITA